MQNYAEADKITVLIMDEQSLFREGLKRILDSHVFINVVAESVNGPETVKLARELHPQVALIDFHAGQQSSIKVLRRLLEACPNTKVIILANENSCSHINQALQLGASGYLFKNTAAENVIKAVTVAANGGSYLDTHASYLIIKEYQRLAKKEIAPKKDLPDSSRIPSDLFTRRESEILQLMAEGNSNRSLGKALYISEKTVKNHISNIFQKMGVTDRTQAVVTAIKKGWVEI